MNAVVTLRPEHDLREALTLIQAVASELGLTAESGDHDTWEFCFENVSYGRAHGAVVGALRRARPDWSSLVTVEYALVV